jgi:uncharacterized protein YdaU (DUF1376 family)
MSKAPAMPFFVDAYMADTMWLKHDEDGIYIRLLMCMWQHEGKLPADDDSLAMFARVSKTLWKNRYKSKILGFFDEKDGFLTQKRLKKEWVFVQKRSEKARKNGRSFLPNSLNNNNTDSAVGAPTEGTTEPRESELQQEQPNPIPIKKESTVSRASARPTGHKAKKSIVSEEWKPSEAGIAYALEQGIGASEINQQTEKFVDYFRAKGERKADWDLAWKIWCRIAIERKKAGKPEGSEGMRRLIALDGGKP